MATLDQVSTSSGGTWSTSIVGKDTSSTTESRPTISSTSTMTSNPYLVFNCSSLPTGATVTAISAKIKMRAYSSSRTASVQLYNGTTSISSKLTVSSTSTSNISTVNSTSIPSSFTNLRLYFGASSTSSSYRPYVYGAVITLTYTIPGKTVKYTIVGSGDIVQTPSGTSIELGADVHYDIKLTAGSLTALTDNGTNVLSRVKQKTIVIPDRSIADSDFTLTQRGTASYGFTKQTADLTYTSTMSGNSARAGCTRFTTNFSTETEITLTMKWNTSNASDYVYVGNFDTSLSTSTTQPSSGTYQFRQAGTTTSFTYTMTVPSGSHYFDMYNYHYRSNSSRACTVVFSGNICKEEPVPNEYTYDIVDVQADHTLVFTFDSSSKTCKITYNGTTISSKSESGSINITYNGSTIASGISGTKTLNCAGKIMASDVVIGLTTLNCANKFMDANIVVTVS